MSDLLDKNLRAIFVDEGGRRLWLSTPNPDLGSRTPQSLIAEHREDEVLDVLKRQLGYAARDNN